MGDVWYRTREEEAGGAYKNNVKCVSPADKAQISPASSSLPPSPLHVVLPVVVKVVVAHARADVPKP